MIRENETIDLFVPGRLCLFGEHSDWAGLHRIINSGIVPGQAIVSGIEQGIYATVSAADQFIIESDLTEDSFVCDMDTALLREKANEGGYYSYVAGVASYMNEYYSVGGLRIHITKQTLPIKSGLSSSAAICVLAARAFNQVYKLRISIVGEMQIAFYGEQRTPSRCGRLDQACAYGVKPVHMVFDGNEIETRPLKIAKPLYWAIADLKASKDTVKILSDLNKCYPFAENDRERAVHEALGEDNAEIVEKAMTCIENGDVEELGHLMTVAQQNFDRKVAPSCPEELNSPVLHSVLNDPHIQTWIYGCKGVGSQGDGTVQFLARDEESREKLIRYLEEERGMEAFTLTLKPQQKVRKAVIPVAGFGTRLYPATKAIKKDFLPVLDRDGMFKPVIMVLLEELIASGIQEICLVIGEDEKPVYDAFFARMSEENYEKLPEEKQKYEDFIVGLKSKIHYVYQRERKGFGHAVYQSCEFADGEPVLLLLGDTIYESAIGKTCSQQMIDTYEEYGQPVISMHEIPLEEVVHYGIMRGEWADDKERYAVLEEIAEKPTEEYAKDHLKMIYKQKQEKYYAVFGQYILTKEVYDVLEKNIREGNYSRGEIQLTDALEEVREKSGMMGCRIQGRSYDVGLPEMYIDTISRFGREYD
ncbi:MAG: sugar phosphate nucleotidyltransferase [Oscillospiraceae bacterium]